MFAMMHIMLAGLLQASASTPYAARHPAVYAGVYAIRFCHGDCVVTPSAWDRTGTLVLSARPLLNQRGWWMRQDMERDPVNGCLLLDPANAPRGNGPFDPHTSRRRLLTWQAGDETGAEVYFAFDRSPDDISLVTMKLSAVGLTGYGLGFDFVLEPDPSGTANVRRDQVVATRTGPADPELCPHPPPLHPVGVRQPARAASAAR